MMSNEALKLPFIHKRFHLDDSEDILWVGFEFFTVYYVLKESCLFGKKGAFIWIQHKSKLVKSNKKLSEREYIFLECLSMNQVVVTVGRCVCMRFNSGQGLCYTFSENLFSGHKAKNQACILVALTLKRKGSFVAIEFIDGDLPVTSVEIECQK